MVNLKAHIETLLKGNLEEAHTFFKTNISNCKMQGHFTAFGNRIITVQGYEGSISISKLINLLNKEAADCVLFGADAKFRLIGRDITLNLQTLNAQAENEKKVSSFFGKFLDQNFSQVSLHARIKNCEDRFKTYNLLQFQNEFAEVDAKSLPKQTKEEIIDKNLIVKIRTAFMAMYYKDVHQTDDPADELFIQTSTGRVVKDDQTIDSKDLRRIFTHSKYMYKGFVVPAKLIKEKLAATKSPVCIPLISPIMTKQIEDAQNAETGA